MFGKNTYIGIAVIGTSMLLSGCLTSNTESGWPSTPFSVEQERYDVFTDTKEDRPTLVVTNEPPPEVVYSRGSRDTVFDTKSLFSSFKKSNKIETIVTRKVNELRKELFSIQKSVAKYDKRLLNLQQENEVDAGQYYALTASVSAQLQTGTTPGNPVLIERWNGAQSKLNNLSQSTGLLNDLATDFSNDASKAAFLLDATRATFGLSGAVEQDHEDLTLVEDEVNQLIVRIERLLNNVNDEINRRTTYLRAERLNMQALSLAIANGELYGQSLSNRLFARTMKTGDTMGISSRANAPVAQANKRPLVIIRFDQANVEYEQAVYTAISQALEKYPSAQFDLIAVSTAKGNAAEIALASSTARKNGESVLRTLTQMGLPMERINLNIASSEDVMNSEVHIYIQ